MAALSTIWSTCDVTVLVILVGLLKKCVSGQFSFVSLFCSIVESCWWDNIVLFLVLLLVIWGS